MRDAEKRLGRSARGRRAKALLPRRLTAVARGADGSAAAEKVSVGSRDEAAGRVSRNPRSDNHPAICSNEQADRDVNIHEMHRYLTPLFMQPSVQMTTLAGICKANGFRCRLRGRDAKVCFLLVLPVFCILEV